MLSELLVVGVTLFATSHRKGLEGALAFGQLSLSEVLFRNGASFLCVRAVWTLGYTAPYDCGQLLTPIHISRSAICPQGSSTLGTSLRNLDETLL